MQYRREVDGLRAIAVVPVILFHAGIDLFSGGFIGVDIFFVISGFLITSILIEDIHQQRFSLKNFYERRCRRILPALFTVLLVTSILAYIFMPVELLKSYANSLMSVVTFTSNFHFYVSSGYFSTAAEQKPLLHTWSLAIEEQYYLLFPFLLVYSYKISRSYALKLVGAITLISLLLCQFLASNHYTDANFYLIFSRAWELLAGSILAIVMVNKPQPARSQAEFFALLGLAMIIWAIFAFDDNTPFPSVYALLPVVGTVFILGFANSTTYVGKLLANAVFVNIGLISYSLYLWHQPLFAFLRMKSHGEPSVMLFYIAIALTFVLATLTYRFIEQPWRDRSRPLKRTIFQYTKYGISFFMILGIAGVATRGAGYRFENNYTDTIKSSPKRKACHTKGANYLEPSQSCQYGGTKVSWASFGDSHTIEAAYALSELLKQQDKGLQHLSFSGCAPALTFTTKNAGCTQWVRDGLIFLEQNQEIENVYLGFRYSAFIDGDHQASYPELPTIDIRTKMVNLAQGTTEQQAIELYWQGFNQIVERLLSAGKTVYVQYPVPELPDHITTLLTPFSIFSDSYAYDLIKTTPSSFYFARNQDTLTRLDKLPYSDKLIAIKPYEVLCTNNFCPAVRNQQALYFDDGHLSVAGAKQLLNGSLALISAIADQ